MVLTVYGPPFSTCVKRVVTTLEELQVPYTKVDINLMTGENKQPDYLKKQPFGKVPVLEDSEVGVTLFESRSIVRYLVNKYADKATTLYGADLKQRAITDNWMEAESQNFTPPTATIVAQRVFSKWSNKQPDEAVVAQKLQELEKVLDVYEGQLATRPFIAGNDFTVADIVHMPYFAVAVTLGKIEHVLDSRPNVKAWWERCTSRASWKKIDAALPGV